MKFFPEMLYYAEAEGLLPTRAVKINAVIAAIKRDPRSEIDLSDFKEILEDNGLDYNDLSEREIRYINAKIS